MLALSPATNVFLNILMVIVCILALIPIYMIVISSITSEAALDGKRVPLMAGRILDHGL